jgi:hypothetical protein
VFIFAFSVPWHVHDHGTEKAKINTPLWSPSPIDV